MKKRIFVLFLICVFTSSSIANPVFASGLEDTADDTKGIEFIENTSDDESAHLVYYMTIDEKRYLIDEIIADTGDGMSCRSISHLVDKKNHIIDGTKKVENTEMKYAEVEKTDNNLLEDDSSNASTSLSLKAQSGEAKSYSTTVTWKTSKGRKITVGALAVIICTTIAFEFPSYFTAVATGLADYFIGAGLEAIPSKYSIYYSGTRAISRSTGKIYYRYNGTFYKDKTKKKKFGKAKWSARWGHGTI